MAWPEWCETPLSSPFLPHITPKIQRKLLNKSRTAVAFTCLAQERKSCQSFTEQSWEGPGQVETQPHCVWNRKTVRKCQKCWWNLVMAVNALKAAGKYKVIYMQTQKHTQWIFFLIDYTIQNKDIKFGWKNCPWHSILVLLTRTSVLSVAPFCFVFSQSTAIKINLSLARSYSVKVPN